MRTKTLLFVTTLALLIAPASASANFGHVVASGETLTSVAAADGLSIGQLAAANGISPQAQLVAGTVLQIPSQSGPSTSAAPAESSAGAAESSSESSAGGSYVVQPGDTLSGIAAAKGLSVNRLAAANGLDPAGVLLAGSTLSLSSGSTGGSTGESDSAPASSTNAPSGGGAQPTSQTVSASQVGQIASENGVSPSLAEAIGYQESGFNNALVSSTGATGVMQLEPSAWSYLNHVLGARLSPASATDNIRGGVMLLHSLLDSTGGNPALTAASYYQGLASVRAHGMYNDTQQYVKSVLALQSRFGGQ